MSALAARGSDMGGLRDDVFVDACRRRLESSSPYIADGRVCSLVGVLIEGEGVPARLGSVCSVEPRGGGDQFEAEVVGFREGRLLLMPLAEPHGVGPGARIRLCQRRAELMAGQVCLGRVLDGLGRPIDGGPDLEGGVPVPLLRAPVSSLTRERVRRSLDIGIRSINSMVTFGRGTRMGIFAGSGVGKSTLLGQIARNSAADINVIALVGERRREVREFIERDLGEALSRSVVVVASSDEAPLHRVRAALSATAIAEHFRDEGREVLLIMDSLTRFCTAQREIGLAVGEPPTTRGYTPSVWSVLPRLLERAGTSSRGGSITGIYSVLVEGDDMNEPVADAARSLLDGHIVLSRALAERNHYPAIDVLSSISRVMPDIVGESELGLAARARSILAAYRAAEDLIAIGAYVAGSDPRIDEAVALREPLERFLRQGRDERSSQAESFSALAAALTRAPVAEASTAKGPGRLPA